MVEVFANQQLIATHARLFKRGTRVTLDAHRPDTHRAVIDLSIERLLERAQAIAPAIAQVLREQFNRKQHPEVALRSAQGILRLSQDFTPEKLIAACKRALQLKTYSYRSVRALMVAQTAVRGTPAGRSPEPGESRQLSLVHDNVRGPEYFH